MPADLLKAYKQRNKQFPSKDQQNILAKSDGAITDSKSGLGKHCHLRVVDFQRINMTNISVIFDSLSSVRWLFIRKYFMLTSNS